MAQELGVDLIVIGSRSLNALDRLLLGSTSEAVARHAPCAVLVVRPRPREKPEPRSRLPAWSAAP